ncbi:L7Ae/L30e/S12e/Gadd45 family ribosomal protein [Fructobacillus ficulneus]|uniref:Ribosomal protein L7A family n=1 Tax=Fructobacillus ficulneus TaxID=157463 RepID=A0A0K8MID4_9LACO|nr:ribosomal L7Ae/L30e/S12e/Gadd45 family protein [Fructobacillus ficulneus]GAP00213.1 ribosomal protein L7A family [Fructobacillus ficulneus]
MNSKDKILQLLGLARRSNNLVFGTGDTLTAIQKSKAKIAFFPIDGGASQQKKFRDKANFYQVTLVEDFTKDELSQAIGLNRSIMAITDNGFAKKINELLKEKERN